MSHFAPLRRASRPSSENNPEARWWAPCAEALKGGAEVSRDTSAHRLWSFSGCPVHDSRTLRTVQRALVSAGQQASKSIERPTAHTSHAPKARTCAPHARERPAHSMRSAGKRPEHPRARPHSRVMHSWTHASRAQIFCRHSIAARTHRPESSPVS